MMRVPNVKTEPGIVVVTMEDGSRWTHFTTITTINRWINSNIGRFNAGKTWMQQSELRRIEE